MQEQLVDWKREGATSHRNRWLCLTKETPAAATEPKPKRQKIEKLDHSQKQAAGPNKDDEVDR
jgi:hypothetical protein